MSSYFWTFLFVLSCAPRFSYGVDFNSTVRVFPDQFFFGVATSAFQTEGGWNQDGKSESIWDHYTHKSRHKVRNRDVADVSSNSYELYERDLEMLQELGVDFYRFSVSWSRLLPSGTRESLNPSGLAYYDRLIDGLVARGVTPFVTLYHWDLPQRLQEMGGWMNPLMAELFEQYADLVFEHFGDRVGHWVTINEPLKICAEGYGMDFLAPAANFTLVGDYMCGHTVLQAHARAYQLYDKKYRPSQKGNIGISLDAFWTKPASTREEDIDAAERLLQFYVGWFLHPIFTEKGDYPPIMKSLIDKKSKEQGFLKSRLPNFTEVEIEALKGSSDFIGLNHYTTKYVRHTNVKQTSTYLNDAEVEAFQNNDWPASEAYWLKTVPWGFHKLLNWIKNEYNNPEVLITENGFATKTGIKDHNRIVYMNQYLNALLDALEDDCRVSAYTVWALMDTFEWTQGYSVRFGLYEVDFSDRNKKRIPRESAKYYHNIIKTKSIKAYSDCIDCLNSNSNHINYNTMLV